MLWLRGMFTMNKILMGILVVFLCHPNNIFANNDNVRTVVNNYVVAQFKLGEEEYFLKYVKFSSKHKEFEYLNYHAEEGSVYDIIKDPLFIVDSYEIHKIICNGNKAEALIKYKRLARTNGRLYNREIITDILPNDVVKLHIIKSGNSWFIVDPPLPRVSIQVLKNEYEKLFKRLYP